MLVPGQRIHEEDLLSKRGEIYERTHRKFRSRNAIPCTETRLRENVKSQPPWWQANGTNSVADITVCSNLVSAWSTPRNPPAAKRQNVIYLTGYFRRGKLCNHAYEATLLRRTIRLHRVFGTSLPPVALN